MRVNMQCFGSPAAESSECLRRSVLLELYILAPCVLVVDEKLLNCDILVVWRGSISSHTIFVTSFICKFILQHKIYTTKYIYIGKSFIEVVFTIFLSL